MLTNLSEPESSIAFTYKLFHFQINTLISLFQIVGLLHLHSHLRLFEIKNYVLTVIMITVEAF